MSVSKEQVIEFIKNMSVIELSEFVKELSEIFGVSASAPVAQVAVAAAAAAPEVEEKTEFDVILTDGGPEKVKTIKVVREVTGLGLKESKTLVEEAPKPLKNGVKKDEADKIKASLEAVGAKVEIK